MSNSQNLIDLLQVHADVFGNKLAYSFINGDEEIRDELSFSELYQRSCSLAALLQQSGAGKGDRIAIMYPSGIHYIVCWFACVLAGAIAVPLYPPKLRREDLRLAAVLQDCGARFVLAEKSIIRLFAAKPNENNLFSQLIWLDAEKIDEALLNHWVRPDVSADSLAFLQYTSGSTGNPKGVMISHGNILDNQRVIKRSFTHTENTKMVSWLPLFHDMGLIGSTLQPFYLGASCYFMAPASFLQKPIRWLDAISRFGGTTGGAPNFAYDLCVRQISEEQCENISLDLSTWEIAFNGAEPVRKETIDRFVKKFSRFGFKETAITPCYGMAESTLMVTSARREYPSGYLYLDKNAEAKRRVQLLADASASHSKCVVACGKLAAEDQILIVNPDNGLQCRADEIGEIWLRGKSIAQGYWQKPDINAQYFGASLPDDAQRKYFRTGDLGFIHNQEIYISGRLKDILIFNGVNYYPQDIEAIVADSNPAFAPDGIAAFSVEKEGNELLVVVAEIQKKYLRTFKGDDLTEIICQQVYRDCGIAVNAVVLVKPHSIPKTSSGKIQRFQCRKLFLEKNLASVFEGFQVQDKLKDFRSLNTHTDIYQWLLKAISQIKEIDSDIIDPDLSLSLYGLDSVAVVTLCNKYEEYFKESIEPSVFFEYATLNKLTAYLLGADVSSNEMAAQAPPAIKPEEPVAIIGIACRFPAAPDKQAFWSLLTSATDAVQEVPKSRWDIDQYYDPQPMQLGKVYARKGGFIDDIELFDHEFFNISPREAKYTAPQQRLLLELSYAAFEDAGIASNMLAGSNTGVFVGISNNEYGAMQTHSGQPLDAYWSTGNALSIAANRISYYYDLRGPSLAIDTACSSSLVAVHNAVQSIRRGECDHAIVAGANLILTPNVSINFAQSGSLSADGKCKVFDAAADGMVRGEGVAVVILKPLSLALAEGNDVYAVIKGSAVNQDGATQGITAPNRQSQAAVLAAAYRNAGLDAVQCQYVEAHGTGTLLGDPIEVSAIGEIIGKRVGRHKPCAIGSVKSNIGHLEAAAGIVGLIKTALCIKNGVIVPSIHFHEENPYLHLNENNLVVQDALTDWQEVPHERVAGVSAFGFGGTNAHVVLQGVEERADKPSLPDTHVKNIFTENQRFIFAISAKNTMALRAMAANVYALLYATENDAACRAICVALMKRNHFKQRLSVAFSTRAELLNKLSAFIAQEEHPDVNTTRNAMTTPGCVFVFSGFRSQWEREFTTLYSQEVVFREKIHACAQALEKYISWNLVDIFQHGLAVDVNSEIEKYQCSQFAYQIAIAALFASWGVKPSVIIGHSFGELAAAVTAGVLTLDEGAKIIFYRSHLLAEATRSGSCAGAMMAVEMRLEDIGIELAGFSDQISIAVNNSETSVVLSGNKNVLQTLTDQLNKKHIFARMLDAPGAGHSHYVDAILPQFIAAIAGIEPRQTSVSLYSSVTSLPIEGVAMTVQYWADNLRKPVMFADTLNRVLDKKVSMFIEIGPYPPVLSPAISQGIRRRGLSLPVYPGLRRNMSQHDHVINTLAALYCVGETDSLPSYIVDAPVKNVELPCYPWQKNRHWLDLPHNTHTVDFIAGSRPSQHPMLRGSISVPVGDGIDIFPVHISAEKFPYLLEHQVQGVAIFPTTGYLEIIHAACRDLLGQTAFDIEDLTILQAMFISTNDSREVQVLVVQEPNNRRSIRCVSRLLNANAAPWITHITAWVVPRILSLSTLLKTQVVEFDDAQIKNRLPGFLNRQQHYNNFLTKGVQYGNAFNGVESVWYSEAESVAKITAPAEISTALSHYIFHPALFDACLQSLLACTYGHSRVVSDGDIFLPVGIKRISLYQAAITSNALYATAILKTEIHSNTQYVVGNVNIFDATGTLVAFAEGFTVKYVGLQKNKEKIKTYFDSSYAINWTHVDHHLMENNRKSTGSELLPTVLLLSESDTLSDQLKEKINSNGQGIYVVYLSNSYRKINDTTYALDAKSKNDYGKVLHEIYASSNKKIHLIHAASSGTVGHLQLTPQQLLDEQYRGTYSISFIITCLNESDLLLRSQLSIVTSGIMPAAINDNKHLLNVPGLSLPGFVKVIGIECPSLTPRVFSLSDIQSGYQLDLLNAFLFSSIDEQHLVITGKGSYVPRLKRLHENVSSLLLDDHSSHEKNGSLIRSDASYLLAGGLGGIGWSVAEWLMERGATSLIIITRRTEQELDDQTQHNIQQARTRNVIISVVSLDITATESASVVAASIQRIGRPLCGVFHFAAVVEPGLLVDLAIEQYATVMAPKIQGAWTLHQATLDAPLDFFVMFSSAASLLGTPGQANYVAANSFLDGFAHYRSAQGLPALTINWGGWKDAGMLVRAEATNTFNSKGFTSMGNEDALFCLEKFILEKNTQVAAMAVDWAQVVRAFPAIKTDQFYSALLHEVTDQSVLFPDIKLDHAAFSAMTEEARYNFILNYLTRQISSSMGMKASDLADNKPINTFGIDSLMALETKNRIEKDFRVVVPVVKFLEGPTVKDLTTFLLHEINRDLLAGVNAELANLPEKNEARADYAVAELFDLVNELSEEEVAALLMSLEAEEKEVHG